MKSICGECKHVQYCGKRVIGSNNTFITGCSQFDRKKPVTNADRIRAMSDEELADWLVMNGDGSDYETWLDWLKQENA